MTLKDIDIFNKSAEQLLLDGYNGLNENKNNFSYWFPKIKDCGIEIPKTFYAKVPIEVYKDLLNSLDNDDLKLNNLQHFLSEKINKEYHTATLSSIEDCENVIKYLNDYREVLLGFCL